MKPLITVFLLTILFAVIFLHSQNSLSRDGSAQKPMPIFRSDFKKRMRHGNDITAPPGLRDYLLQQSRSKGRFDVQLGEKDFFQKRRQKSKDKAALLRSERLSQPRNAQSGSAHLQPTWVQHYASQSLPGIDAATAIAIDGSGNVYVTGYSTGSPFGTDYLTVKYDATGTQFWEARYHGDGQAENWAHAIAVDGSGNIYVTGESYGSGTSWDYATIKYDPAGNQQWVARYNGPGNSGDYAYALAVDGAGNVYVTGESAGFGTSDDYATIKYNAVGVEQWVARYNGPENSDDDAIALAIDGVGNVYITGRSEGLGTFYDYATVKYNTAGEQQWASRYNKSGSSFDDAAALAVDASGNVYVTGTSRVGPVYSDSAACTTIKYNTTGDQQWVASYAGPGNYGAGANALAIDDVGNVYVTGSSANFADRTTSDCATIKYNNSGVQQWVAHYSAPGTTSNGGDALTIDSAGDVYVTGYSFGPITLSDYTTIKYNAVGEQQWIKSYNGPGDIEDSANAIAIDGAGNLYVTGYSAGSETDGDYGTIKYNAAGELQWIARYNGPKNSSSEVAALAVDRAGNVYVTGYSEGLGTSDAYSADDYATVKYNAAGERQWIARYSGPPNSDDDANALAVDVAGNVFVTGVSGGNFATIKYNADGIQQWIAHYDGPENDIDYATALTVDGAGNVYVTGFSRFSGTAEDYATIKYNASGEQQWIAYFNGAGNSSDGAAALAVDNAGNVYVTGYSATIKYNSAGVEQWVVPYDGSGNFKGVINDLAVDGSGNVYVTGYGADSGTSAEYVTIKYDAAGVQKWIALYNGPENLGGSASALAIDSAGNVYVTGYSQSSETSSDFATIKYNAAGKQQWVARYNGPENSFEGANALAVDSIGNVYVTGASESPASDVDDDYVTVKYNAAGAEQWIARYISPGSDGEGAKTIAIDSAGSVYVAGTSAGDDWSVYTTIKYVQTPVAVKEKASSRSNIYNLSQNYPNPFNPSTTIRYALAKPDHVTLKVFNLTGQEVATLVNEVKGASEHSVQWNSHDLPSGIYMYRLQAADFVETKKMILLR